MRKGMLIILVLIIGLMGCGKNDVSDQVTNVLQADDPNVLMVKNGHPTAYPDKNYGEAFGAFFKDPTWKYFKGTQEGPDDDGDGKPDYTVEDIDVVEFTGYCSYMDVEVKALVQFTLDKDKGTFEATYLSFNEVPQTTLMLYGLMSKVFEDEEDSTQVQQNNTQTTTDTKAQATPTVVPTATPTPTPMEEIATEDTYAYYGKDISGTYECLDGEWDDEWGKMVVYSYSVAEVMYDDGDGYYYIYIESKDPMPDNLLAIFQGRLIPSELENYYTSEDNYGSDISLGVQFGDGTMVIDVYSSDPDAAYLAGEYTIAEY